MQAPLSENSMQALARAVLAHGLDADAELIKDLLMETKRPVRLGEFLDLIQYQSESSEPVWKDILSLEFSTGTLTIRSLLWQPANGDDAFRLTEKERDLLVVLALADGYQMSREDLLPAVWRYRPDLETHTLETHVYRLRRKIELQADKPEVLLTTEGGYKLDIKSIERVDQ